MVVISMIFIVARHFGNVNTGISTAVLYLFSLTPRFISAGPSMHCPLMIWAIVSYRRPVVAGVLLGLASATVYYPIFLLPLWVSFYWQRGKWRFVGGVAAAWLVLIVVLGFNAESIADFGNKLSLMTGFMFPTGEPEGFGILSTLTIASIASRSSPRTFRSLEASRSGRRKKTSVRC